jgi:uncharacterized damage-inducible protein DinB
MIHKRNVALEVRSQCRASPEDLDVIDVEAFQELFRYNHWAHDRVFEAVSRSSQEAFTRDLGSSHPSVRDTLTHIVWSEWIWLQRWKGSSPRTVFRGADFPESAALRTRWLELATEQRAFLETLTAERLLTVVRYVNLEGHTWQYPLWRQMYHVVNHSSYHRGQVITMLRQLGAQVVPTDFLVYHDELQREHQ